MTTSYVKILKSVIVLLLALAANFAEGQCTLTASYTYSVGANGQVTFSATPTFTTANYYWSFYGNSGPFGTQNYTVPTSAYTFTANGTYTVFLSVYYSGGSPPACSTATANGTIFVNTVPTPTCIANLTSTVGTNGNVTLTATTPTFSPAYYTWNFAAGTGGGYSTTYTSNPTASFTYSSNGCYVIGLQIGTSSTFTAGCYNNLQNTVCVSTAPCNATPLSFMTYLGSAGMVSFFNTNGSALVPISGYSQVWNFGDGGTSTVTTGTSANHTYSANGTYTVGLTIANTNYTPTCISTGSTVVTVTNVPATCNASFNYSVGANGLVTFSSTSTGSVNSSTSYTWSFGSQATPSSSTGVNIPNVSTTYLANGVYTVYLGLYNANSGVQCSTTQTIAVNTVTTPCSMNANFYTYQSCGGYVYFGNSSTGTLSSVSYSWDFGDGTYTVTPSFPFSAAHTYTANGAYTVTLMANNNSTPSCTSTQTAIVVVNSAGPAASANISYSVGANGNVTYTCNATPSSSSTVYNWYSNNGTPITYTGTPTVSITYTTNGNYLTTVWVYNPVTACTTSAYATVTVNTAPCNMNANFSTSQACGGYVYFGNATTGATSGTSYFWDLGDGTNTVFISSGHTYTANGTYTVTLTATNNNYTPSCVSTHTSLVLVNSVGGAISANVTYSVGANGNVTYTCNATPSSSSTVYNWYSNNGTSLSYTGTTNASITYTANGNYYTTVYVYNPVTSCSTSANATVTVNSVTIAPCNMNANFSYTLGTCGDVIFANTTSGATNGTSYLWSFGDGTTWTNNSLILSHTYTVNAVYVASLTATNNNYTPACVSTKTAVFTVTNFVLAAFTYSQGANGQVTFSNTSIGINPAGTTYTWNFTWNNSASAVPNYTQGINIPPTVSTTYTANGTYTVVFQTGGVSCNSSAGQTITINSVGTSTCNLNANFSYTQGSNGVVNFNNTSTNTGTNTNYYWWNFGDNSSGASNSLTSPTHTYASNGTYLVTLKDSTFVPSLCISTHTAYVTVNSISTPTPCGLNTNFTYTTGANGICYFNNTTTGAPAGTTYTWTFGDGNSSNVNSPSHTYASNGTYWVMLFANANSTANPNCIDSTAHSVIISNITNTCIANTTFSIVPSGSPHSWYAVVTNTGNVAAAQWAWGDSTANSFGIVTSHTYAAAGNYNICLTVTTTCGTIGTHCSSQYLNKTSGDSQDIIYINCITPDMLPTGIKNNPAELVSCLIAPNPNSGEFNVSVSDVNFSAKIRVYNLMGEIIFETTSEANNGSINENVSLNNALNGVYFIKINAGDKIHTQKLIINK